MSYKIEYFPQAEITSYQDAYSWFARCRKPEDGRPLRKWCRVFKVGDTFEFRLGKTVFAVLTPDNVMTFPLTASEVKRVSITLSSSLQRALPFLFQRLAMGRYLVAHSLSVDNRSTDGWVGYYMRHEALEYFAGIQFNMTNGECLNPRPRLTESINTQARKQWVQASRDFRKGIAVRAKLGVFDGLCQRVQVDRRSGHYKAPDWDNPQWQNMLYEAMRDGQYPMELLSAFVQSTSVSWWRKEAPSAKAVVLTVENLIKRLNVELRRSFGVFDGA